MAETLRGALIGCGFFARNHLHAWRAIEGVELAVVCDLDEGRVNPRVRGEDAATMLLGHAGGAASVVDCSYATRIEPDPFPETLVEVDGDAGSIRLAPGYALTVHSRGRTERRDVPPGPLPWAEPPWHVAQESVLNIQRDWIDCLRTGREPATSARDNIKTFALVEAAYEAAATGRVVEPEGGDD